MTIVLTYVKDFNFNTFKLHSYVCATLIARKLDIEHTFTKRAQINEAGVLIDRKNMMQGTDLPQTLSIR